MFLSITALDCGEPWAIHPDAWSSRSSAARTSEALTAQWTEFDRQARTWTIPAAKMKCRERHVVYLNGLPPLHRRECVRRPASPRSLGRNQANRDPRGSPFLKSYSSETSWILW